MALTTSQFQTLAADVATSEFGALPHTSDNAFAIAQAYNLEASPVFVVWKTNIPTSDAKVAMDWTEFIGRSAGEREAWTFMISNNTINAADVNIRQGIQDIFSGAGGSNTRTNLVAIAKRNALRIEALFATGVGTMANPGTMTHEGLINYQHILTAWVV